MKPEEVYYVMISSSRSSSILKMAKQIADHIITSSSYLMCYLPESFESFLCSHIEYKGVLATRPIEGLS